MRRASFTVVAKGGILYDANHLSITNHYDNGVGAESVVNFICSGAMMTIRADEVAEIIFHSNGAQHCGECDRSIGSVVGFGIHSN